MNPQHITRLNNTLNTIMLREQEEKRNCIACIIQYKEQHGATPEELFNTVIKLWEQPLYIVSQEVSKYIDQLMLEIKNKIV